MRSSLDCLFVSSWPMLFIVSPLHFAWFVSGSRSFICCYLVADVIHCTVLLPGFFAISISLRGLPVFSLSIGFVPRYRRFIALLYNFSKATTLLQFSRHEKFFGLFVCFLTTDVIYCTPIAFCLLRFRLEKFSLLLPHSRCNSLHFSGFFAISISLRFCLFLIYQFVLFLITGVLSRCYTFSLKATSLLRFSRHEKFIYSFVPSWPMLFIAFLLLLYTRNFAWYNGFS